MAPTVTLAISGDIVPLRSNNRRLVIRGTAYIDAGRIVAVRPKAAVAPSGFNEADVARIDCGRSWIFPGLIDLPRLAEGLYATTRVLRVFTFERRALDRDRVLERITREVEDAVLRYLRPD